jgi:hypothetical protein
MKTMLQQRPTANVPHEPPLPTEAALAQESRRRGDSGFALILAILALMLLTFLGLTLAATTSTELQIATNYRWSQQAFYNAEAGLEAARLVLAQVAQAGGGLGSVLPAARANRWDYGKTGDSGGPPDPTILTPARPPLRDYELMGCADRAGVGYGLILTQPGTPPVNLDGVSQFMGTPIDGAFSVWVRRRVISDDNGQFADDNDPNPTAAVVTAEGVAPYTASAFDRRHQARRVLEVAYMLLVNEGRRCQGLSGQEGLSASGENFDPCSPLDASGIAGAFGQSVTENLDVQ